MRYPWLVARRTVLLAISLVAAAVALVAGSGNAVDAKQTSSSRSAPATSSCYGDVCFELVNPEPSECNEITGINDFEDIIGVYYTCPVGTNVTPYYYSVAAPPSPEPTHPYGTLPPYPTFTPDSDGSVSTFLQGLGNGAGGKLLKGLEMVGYTQATSCNPACLLLTQGVIVQDNNSGKPTFTSIQDSEQGTGACANTVVGGVNAPGIGVGSYEIENPSGSGCVWRSFEFYCPANATCTSSGEYDYVDIPSPPPPSSTSVGSATSWTATSINDLGDIVGTVTFSGSSTTFGWLYADLNYYTFQIGSGSTYYNTYPEGINVGDGSGQDGVAGYYNNASGNDATGFLTTHSQDTPHPVFTPIQYGSSQTIIRSLNTHWYITGSAYVDGTYQGFVGYCNSSCRGKSSDSKRASPIGSSKSPQLQLRNKPVSRP
jgi:hypothetical protein